MPERLTAFLKTITDFADAQCSDLEFKAQSFKDENIISYQQEAKQKSRDYIEYEIQKDLTAVNKTISDYESEKKSALISLRTSITDNIFAEVREKTEAFVNSVDYENFLLRSAVALKNAMGDDTTILVGTKDMKYTEKIRNTTNCTVKEDSTIISGGLKGINKDGTVVTDDTLDSRLDTEYRDFIKKSNLKIF